MPSSSSASSDETRPSPSPSTGEDAVSSAHGSPVSPDAARLVAVNPAWLDDVWPEVEPTIERVSRFPEHDWTAADVYEDVKGRLIVLWLIVLEGEVVGVGATQIENVHGYRVCYILFLTEQKRKNWQHLIEEIERWAQDEEGCVAIRAEARRGWERIVPEWTRTKRDAGRVALMKKFGKDT